MSGGASAFMEGTCVHGGGASGRCAVCSGGLMGWCCDGRCVHGEGQEPQVAGTDRLGGRTWGRRKMSIKVARSLREGKPWLCGGCRVGVADERTGRWLPLRGCLVAADHHLGYT